MTNLTRAYRQLFSRPDDERFPDLDSLYTYCHTRMVDSEVSWKSAGEVIPMSTQEQLGLKISGSRFYEFNDWSFGQACQLADVKKETLNRLKPTTATQVLLEMLPNGGTRPYQVMTYNGQVSSIHGASYSRLYDADLLGVVIDEADNFLPPPVGFNGATGLYAGQQDMFAFLIDDQGWVDIDGEQFAPGFFVWNSEVGRRTVGIETFWFQRVCSNHIVWDATEVCSYKRKHTANVIDALSDIRSILRRLVTLRNERRDCFAKRIRDAMNTSLGSTPEDVSKVLSQQGISAKYIKEALDMMTNQSGGFTVFRAVDSLTRLTGRIGNAGDRFEQDIRIGKLLGMAS